jgi:hypothetical protein
MEFRLLRFALYTMRCRASPAMTAKYPDNHPVIARGPALAGRRSNLKMS